MSRKRVTSKRVNVQEVIDNNEAIIQFFNELTREIMERDDVSWATAQTLLKKRLRIKALSHLKYSIAS
jgi:hypothetical protein